MHTFSFLILKGILMGKANLKWMRLLLVAQKLSKDEFNERLLKLVKKEAEERLLRYKKLKKTK